MKICIADCNHGFFDPEQEEAFNIGVDLDILNCSQNDLVEKCQGANIIIVQRLFIDGKTIDSIPSCKVVTRYGVGLDNVNCDELRKRNVKIVNFPSFCTEEVSNHTLMAILFLYRQYSVLQQDYSNLPKQWGNPKSTKSIQSANNTTVSIIGLGRIGGAVAKRLISCGFKVIGYDPYISHNRWTELNVIQMDSINSTLANSNIASIHVPLTPETLKFIDKSNLKLIPKGGHLINMSRGEVLNTEDLIESLNVNIQSAFIDVCDPEPVPEDLLNIPNLHISNHCAFYSQESLEYLKRHVIIDSVKQYEM